GPSFRETIEFLSADVVGDEGTAIVDQRRRLRRNLHRFSYSADPHLSVHFERASEDDADVGTLDGREPAQFENDLVAAGVQVRREELSVRVRDERASLS